MIYEEIMYGIRCDRCREIYENGNDYTVSSDKEEMVQDAIDDDWHTEGKRHYCPNCYTRHPQEDSDDDKIVVKPLIHHSFFSFWNMLKTITHNYYNFSEDDENYYLTNQHCYNHIDYHRTAILNDIIYDFRVEYKEPKVKFQQFERRYEHEIFVIPKNFRHKI